MRLRALPITKDRVSMVWIWFKGALTYLDLHPSLYPNLACRSPDVLKFAHHVKMRPVFEEGI